MANNKMKSPKADAAMAILGESMPVPGGMGGMEEMAIEGPAPGGGDDLMMGIQGLLDSWEDKEHPYYKDVEALVMGASA